MANFVILALLMVAAALPLLSLAEHSIQTSKSCEQFTYTTCPCGNNGGFIMVPIKLCYMKDFYSGKKTCRPCPGSKFNEKVCEKYLNCETCVSGMEKCMTCPRGKTGTFCGEVIAFQVPSGDTYPIIIRIPRGGFPPHVKARFVRDTEGCPVPDNLETAEIECTVWPKHISCTETCVFGFTLPDGLTRELSCKFEEDAWKPSEFDECKPYLDCTVQLISAGDVFCTTQRLKSGATCDINCEEYEGHPAVPKTRYECKADGEWNPPLPFCAEKGKEPTVAPPPPKAGGPAAAAAAAAPVAAQSAAIR